MGPDEWGDFTEILRAGSKGRIMYNNKNLYDWGGHSILEKLKDSLLFLVVKIILRDFIKRKIDFKLDGDKPSFIDMPIWYTYTQYLKILIKATLSLFFGLMNIMMKTIHRYLYRKR